MVGSPATQVRLVRKIARPWRREVKPLAPATVEAMRGVAAPRDAALLSVLAYAGLRPQEALALQWGDVRERTLLIQRAVSLGQENDTKTRAHRTVRLLAPLREDLLAWRLRSGRPGETALVFPGPEGRLWTKTTYDNWRKRAFDRACRPRRRSGPPRAPRVRVVCAPTRRMARPAGTMEARVPRCCVEHGPMELVGLEPTTSWVRSRRSPN